MGDVGEAEGMVRSPSTGSLTSGSCLRGQNPNPGKAQPKDGTLM